MQKNKSLNIQAMIVVALLIAISIILSRFSVMIPFFGYPSVRFSITTIPIFLAGALFGPVLGACAGFISDIISFTLFPNGPYFPGFTLNSILEGLIPGLAFMYLRKFDRPSIINKINIAMAFVAFIGATIYVNFIGVKELENIGTILSLPVNIWITIFIAILILLLVIIFAVIQRKYSHTKSNFSINKILLINIILHIIINLIFTPIWLYHLYNIPVSASVFIRIFKSVIDVPLQVFLIYIVINALPITLIGGKQCKTH